MISARFEISGEFLAFIRNPEGKCRMMLRTPAGEMAFKVPKAIREPLRKVLRPGGQLVVAGCEQSDRFSGFVKRIVSAVQVRSWEPVCSPQACAECPIRVCAKRNCWKNGGKELWEQLEQSLETAGMCGIVKLKAVRCLGNCKQAPNLTYRHELQARCTPQTAKQLIARIVRESAGKTKHP